MGHHEMMWKGWGGHMFGWWGVLLAVLIAGAIVYFIARSANKEGETTSANETPMDVLERRYAEGEIDQDEFHRRKTDLEN